VLDEEVVMDGYGKRVLIAEDDEDARNLLILMLEKAGYSVYVALNGRQALEEIRKRRFDVVVADHLMPRMNGYELVLLGRLVRPDIPMILLLGEDTSVAEKAKQGGAYGYLCKPYDASELLGLMRHATLAAQEHRSHAPMSESLPACQ
jgi:two-component system, chemotaxis family, chemotaxis protein CheY